MNYDSDIKGVLAPPMSSIEAWDLGLKVNFTSFVTWLVKGNNYRMDEHWIPMVTACPPCGIKYNLIGHIETFELDECNQGRE